jgi:hypothetical protein
MLCTAFTRFFHRAFPDRLLKKNQFRYCERPLAATASAVAQAKQSRF